MANKYKKLIMEVSYDSGLNWETAYPIQYTRGDLIETDSPDCTDDVIEWIEVDGEYICIGEGGDDPTPGERQTRWDVDGTLCDGYNLYQKLVEVYIDDSTATGNTKYGDLIEVNSGECGYVSEDSIFNIISPDTEFILPDTTTLSSNYSYGASHPNNSTPNDIGAFKITNYTDRKYRQLVMLNSVTGEETLLSDKLEFDGDMAYGIVTVDGNNGDIRYAGGNNYFKNVSVLYDSTSVVLSDKNGKPYGTSPIVINYTWDTVNIYNLSTGSNKSFTLGYKTGGTYVFITYLILVPSAGTLYGLLNADYSNTDIYWSFAIDLYTERLIYKRKVTTNYLVHTSNVPSLSQTYYPEIVSIGDNTNYSPSYVKNNIAFEYCKFDNDKTYPLDGSRPPKLFNLVNNKCGEYLNYKVPYTYDILDAEKIVFMKNAYFPLNISQNAS